MGIDSNGTYSFPQFSNVANPSGFPNWFSWAPTLGAAGAMTYTTTTVYIAKFTINGRLVNYTIRFAGTTGGAASGALTFTVPINRNGTIDYLNAGAGILYDGGDILAKVFWNGASSSTIAVDKNSNFLIGAGKSVYVSGFYEI